jgi:hypothetical protein
MKTNLKLFFLQIFLAFNLFCQNSGIILAPKYITQLPGYNYGSLPVSSVTPSNRSVLPAIGD